MQRALHEARKQGFIEWSIASEHSIFCDWGEACALPAEKPNENEDILQVVCFPSLPGVSCFTSQLDPSLKPRCHQSRVGKRCISCWRQPTSGPSDQLPKAHHPIEERQSPTKYCMFGSVQPSQKGFRSRQTELRGAERRCRDVGSFIASKTEV